MNKYKVQIQTFLDSEMTEPTGPQKWITVRGAPDEAAAKEAARNAVKPLPCKVGECQLVNGTTTKKGASK